MGQHLTSSHFVSVHRPRICLLHIHHTHHLDSHYLRAKVIIVLRICFDYSVLLITVEPVRPGLRMVGVAQSYHFPQAAILRLQSTHNTHYLPLACYSLAHSDLHPRIPLVVLVAEMPSLPFDCAN